MGTGAGWLWLVVIVALLHVWLTHHSATWLYSTSMIFFCFFFFGRVYYVPPGWR
jgi:hypothetical protein